MALEGATRTAPAPGDAGRALTAPTPAVVVRGLRKRYGEVEAVGGIDLTIGRGEMFALLGPNGAGKTSTIEILPLLKPGKCATLKLVFSRKGATRTCAPFRVTRRPV
jgi:ABC-2 type transport system ATP-binding protein